MDCMAGFANVLRASAVALVSLGASQPPAAPLPKSELPVTLLGVAMDADVPARSACLVRCTYPGEQRTRSTFVATGQRACDVAEITEILEDTVVIKNLSTNRLELLVFPAVGAATATPTFPTPEPAAAGPDTVEPSNLITIEVQKDALSRSLANLPELLTSAVATPHFREVGHGQSIVEGFELNSIKEASAVGQLGLQNGDVVLEVNGDKLDSAASILRLLGQAQVMPQAKLMVLRNGQRMTIVVNMK
jgi:type II secretory pathway component PulC